MQTTHESYSSIEDWKENLSWECNTSVLQKIKFTTVYIFISAETDSLFTHLLCTINVYNSSQTWKTKITLHYLLLAFVKNILVISYYWLHFLYRKIVYQKLSSWDTICKEGFLGIALFNCMWSYPRVISTNFLSGLLLSSYPLQTEGASIIPRKQTVMMTCVDHLPSIYGAIFCSEVLIYQNGHNLTYCKDSNGHRTL